LGRRQRFALLRKKPRDPGSKQKQGFWFAKPDFDEIPGSPILFSIKKVASAIKNKVFGVPEALLLSTTPQGASPVTSAIANHSN
jgi:hypothetical protein